MNLKILNEELAEILIGNQNEFPKYTTQILNLANQNAQATRPRAVGQLSDLIFECGAKNFAEWKKWYLQKFPDAIENATKKIAEMLKNLKTAAEKIDEKMIEKWVEDLILQKTFLGLRFQEAILQKVAKLKNENYRLANADEESRGIDGFIGEIAVSIKPISYRTKKNLREEIDAEIIFYEKLKSGLKIDFDF